jgi:glycosyltransferase involved in cell wall biosynthesis
MGVRKIKVNAPLVSVVIPTFNKSPFIEATLMSVLNQTYRNIEIILVDNGSTDDTCFVVKDFISQNQGNFKFISLDSNKGPSNARNHGIMASTGKYIFFLDGDDIFFQNKVRYQVEFMEANLDVGLTITPYIIYSHQSKFLRLIRNNDPLLLIANWLDMTGFGGSVESTGCIRRSHLKSTLLYDTNLMGSEGLDFMLRWSMESIIRVIPEPLTIYRLSPNQLHKDISAIQENMGRLVVKYAKSEKQKVKIAKMQNAFFEIRKLRSHGKKELIPSLVVALLKFDSYRLKMLLSLFKRNLLAFLRGFKYRRGVNVLLKSLE